jgi:hypothetical protein
VVTRNGQHCCHFDLRQCGGVHNAQLSRMTAAEYQRDRASRLIELARRASDPQHKRYLLGLAAEAGHLADALERDAGAKSPRRDRDKPPICVCAANYRSLAAHYQQLAAQPSLPHFREGFLRLAARYAAVAARLEAIENATPSATTDTSSA